ncbi:MAG: hypothetical protein QY332_04425 [Anaerolineales bacterium]|nr:MAG: hypothetical protein QY332_04425 [Anaerolineales bacterium]
MKLSLKKNLPGALLTLALFGMVACGLLQPGSDAADDNAQPTSSPLSNDREAGQSAGNFDCTDINNLHPIGQSISKTHEVPYEQVMTWFCDGYSFENILIALETSKAVDVPANALLEMLLEKEWEEIWRDIGFTTDP